ncbi:MAG TPA: SgcJ/EcaC family oxidoreductase [Aquihabitans sp.]|jgi:uncharacterized protein (TIGR02246 family)|nr:SgcJ/EcaC family oxidoreductase [Aquihabitans sp.]
MTTEADQTVPSEILDALVGRVAELERSQRAEDVDGFLALLASTAVWVTGGGARLVGIEEIAAFTRTVLPGAFADGSVDYRVEHASVLAPGVVLTGVRQTYRDGEGRTTGEGLPSYVWRLEDGAWRIVAAQNTVVPTP